MCPKAVVGHLTRLRAAGRHLRMFKVGEYWVLDYPRVISVQGTRQEWRSHDLFGKSGHVLKMIARVVSTLLCLRRLAIKICVLKRKVGNLEASEDHSI